MRSLKGTNWARLGILCEKMNLHWPDKLCNEILWIILEEKRQTLRDMVTNCGKKNLNKTWSDLKQLAQSRVRFRVGVGIKKIKKRKIVLKVTGSDLFMESNLN